MLSCSAIAKEDVPRPASFNILWLAGLILVPLGGCTFEEADNQSAATLSASAHEDSGGSQYSPVSRDKLLGVYPQSKPLVLKKTGANAFAAFRDGSRIVCANHADVEIWDVTNGEKTLSLQHPEVVIAVALAPDQKLLLTATTGRTSPVRLWNLHTGRQLRAYASPFNDHPTRLDTESSNTGDGAATNASAQWYFPREGSRPQSGLGFTAVAFAPGGRKFATGCEDGTILLWDINGASSIARMSGYVGHVLSIAFSPDGTRMLTSSQGDVVQLWDIGTESQVQEYAESQAPENEKNQPNWVKGHRLPLAFSADGEEFAFYSPRAAAIRICSSRTGDELRRLPEDSRTASGALAVSFDGCLAFLPGGGRLLSNTGWVLKTWDTAAGKVTHRHACKSGVNWGSAYPPVEYVRYLPDVGAAMAVEVENDDNTQLDDWTLVSIVPLADFWNTSGPLRSEECGFAAVYPDEPERITRTVTRASARRPEIQYSCFKDRAYFSVSTVIHSETFPRSERRQNLDEARDRMTHDGVRYTLTEEKDVTVSNEAARECWLEHAEHGDRIRCLLCFREAREYRVMVLAKGAAFPDMAAEAFLRSFELLDLRE